MEAPDQLNITIAGGSPTPDTCAGERARNTGVMTVACLRDHLMKGFFHLSQRPTSKGRTLGHGLPKGQGYVSGAGCSKSFIESEEIMV